MGVSVVLITNVGQGFGRAVALAYGQADYDVVCADKDVTLASKTAAEIEELGGQAIPVQADMSVASDVRATFDKVFEIFGDLSGVVHVAAFESNTPFSELSESEFGELLDEDLKSTFLVLKAAARLLDDAWVVIVSPPKGAAEPHMVGVRGAITRMAAGFESRFSGLSVNVAVPSRAASDPRHDAALVENVMYLGARATGLSGQRFYVTLPPPPLEVEALLPEVRAALDASVRQDDLERSVYDPEDDPDGEDDLEDAEDELSVSGEPGDEGEDSLEDVIDSTW